MIGKLSDDQEIAHNVWRNRTRLAAELMRTHADRCEDE